MYATRFALRKFSFLFFGAEHQQEKNASLSLLCLWVLNQWFWMGGTI
jgi:hypothetical protein